MSHRGLLGRAAKPQDKVRSPCPLLPPYMTVVSSNGMLNQDDASHQCMMPAGSSSWLRTSPRG